MSITNSRMLFNTAVGHRKVDLPKQQSHNTPYHWVFGAFKKRHLPLFFLHHTNRTAEPNSRTCLSLTLAITGIHKGT